MAALTVALLALLCSHASARPFEVMQAAAPHKAPVPEASAPAPAPAPPAVVPPTPAPPSAEPPTPAPSTANAPAPAPGPAPSPEAPLVHTFEIVDDEFVRDGEAVQIISGSVHYFRIRPEQWEDRLLRAKSLGLNAISTYVPWNFHETLQGQYRFAGDADFEAFLALAHSLDLMVLLRLGPYVCGEWDLGGLPSWLLALDPKVALRSEDPFFLAQVDAWWDVLLPRVQPLLWASGGPVVMVQVENEYGYYAVEMGPKVNATAYLTHLVNKTRTALGNDTIIYTTDPAVPAIVGNGTLNGTAVYTVVDAPLAADYDAAFALQKSLNAPGMSPPMTSEFYLGWFTNWGEALPAINATLAQGQLQHILSLNASVNFYMAVGGTNFQSFSGANSGADATQFQPQITSYDYSAPIGEGGDTSSPLYEAVREVISEHLNATLPDAPALPRRVVPAAVNMSAAASLLDSADLLSAAVPATWPKSMEFFGQASGLILYTAPLPAKTAKPADTLYIFGVRDRAQVYVTTPAVPATPIVPGGAPALGPVRRALGVLERWAPKLKLPLAPAAPAPGDLVQILVEDMGRTNFGKYMQDDKKGVGAVLLDFLPLFTWTVNTLNLTDLSAVPFKPIEDIPAGAAEPTFFEASFHVAHPGDAFLSLQGWTKGYAFVNGFNLGRYWPAHGPQCHLYIPAPLLHKGANQLILLELDAAPAVPSVSFTDGPDFSCGPVPLVPPVPALLQKGAASAAATAAV